VIEEMFSWDPLGCQWQSQRSPSREDVVEDPLQCRLLKNGVLNENGSPPGSRPVYLPVRTKLDSMQLRKLSKEAHFTLFVRKLGAPIFTTAGVEGRRLSWSQAKNVLVDVDSVQ
jgi:hypothetical protein